MKKITGTDIKPRLRVFRSNRHIYAQLINDDKQKVIAGASTLTPEIRKKKNASSTERAKEVGKLVAQKAIKENIKKVVFDRRGYKYHGKVKELAQGAREGGLEF